MSIAVTWVNYTPTSPFPIAVKDLPFLDLGIVDPDSNPWTSKFVLGLRFQGQATQNITVSMDDAKADIYPHDGSAPQLRQTLTSYVFKAIVVQDEVSTGDTTGDGFDDGDTDFSGTIDNDVATFTGSPSSWPNTFPTDTLSLGSARLTSNLDSYSTRFAIAVEVPTSQADADLRNFRLLATFETTNE